MTQILLTQAKQEGLVRDYQGKSRAMAANVQDHLKMSRHNTAKCFSVAGALAEQHATIASRPDEWDRWDTTPTEPVLIVPPSPSAVPTVPQSDLVAPMEPVPTAPVSAPSEASVGRGAIVLLYHPTPRCIYHLDACPSRVGREEGRMKEHEHTPHEEPTPPSCTGATEKQKKHHSPRKEDNAET